MRLYQKVKLYSLNVVLTSQRVLGALVRCQPRRAAQMLKREEGQGVLEYVALLSGVAIVLVVVFGIFMAIKKRAEDTKSIIESLPSP